MTAMQRFNPKWLKPIGAACFLALILLDPSSAVHAASQTLHTWLTSTAPALLPFLIAVPALTCEETCLLLSHISGKPMHFLRLPKNAAGAILIGMLSGSPAGAAALMQIKQDPEDSPGAFVRAAWAASGASNAFLLSGIAVGMLNMPRIGMLLLRSQLFSVLLCMLILRPAGSDAPHIHSAAPRAQQGIILSAMLTLLSIGGYMVLFSVLARQLALLVSPALETPLLTLLELMGGCQVLCALDVPLNLKLPLISALSCFGGISVCVQCMSFLSPLGVRPAEYIAGKLVQSGFAALFTHIQLNYFLPSGIPSAFFTQIDFPAAAALLVSCIILILIVSHIIRCRRHPNT